MELSKSKLNKFSLLKNKKFREKEGLFIVQGIKGVKDTISHFNLVALLLKNGYKENLNTSKSSVYELSESDLKKISTLDSCPEVIAIYEIPHKELDLKAPADKFSLVLDGIQDPGNIGTIIRTAHWFGIENIYCSEDCVDIYNPKVIQSTMGSIAAVKVTYCNLIQLFDINKDLPVYGLLLEGENIFTLHQFNTGFIVMGNEGNGIRKEIRGKITRGLTIPPVYPTNAPDSLNVAIATAITLSQIIQ